MNGAQRTMNEMGDKWIWLPTDVRTNNNIDGGNQPASWQEAPVDEPNMEAGGDRGMIRPIPLSPYGRLLYHEVMEQYLPTPPMNFRDQYHDNQTEQICHCECHSHSPAPSRQDFILLPTCTQNGLV